jgi:hypothetical protein
MTAFNRSFGPVITLSSLTVNDISNQDPAAAGYSLLSSGVIQTRINFVPTGAGTWISPQVDMALYEARATLTGSIGSGSLGGSALNTWGALTANYTWELQSTAGQGFCSRELLIEIRLISSGVVQGSATITLNTEAL